MTKAPYTFQYRILSNIAMLSYKKVKGYPAYALSFLPTESIFKPYIQNTHETGLKNYPYVTILDNTKLENVLHALTTTSTSRNIKQSNTIPGWLATAKRWLNTVNIPYTVLKPDSDVTDVYYFKPDYVPSSYNNNSSRYMLIYVSKTDINQLNLVNVPYKVTDSEYILFVRTQITKVTKVDNSLAVYKACTFVLHKHRRILLQSTIDYVSSLKQTTDDEERWIKINEMLVTEEQWLADHESWNNDNLYASFTDDR